MCAVNSIDSNTKRSKNKILTINDFNLVRYPGTRVIFTLSNILLGLYSTKSILDLSEFGDVAHRM